MNIDPTAAMKGNKKNHDPEFKKKAVFLSFGKETIEMTAKKMNISARTLLHWRKGYVIFGEDSFYGSGKIRLSPEQKKYMIYKSR